MSVHEIAKLRAEGGLNNGMIDHETAFVLNQCLFCRQLAGSQRCRMKFQCRGNVGQWSSGIGIAMNEKQLSFGSSCISHGICTVRTANTGTPTAEMILRSRVMGRNYGSHKDAKQEGSGQSSSINTSTQTWKDNEHSVNSEPLGKFLLRVPASVRTFSNKRKCENGYTKIVCLAQGWNNA